MKEEEGAGEEEEREEGEEEEALEEVASSEKVTRGLEAVGTTVGWGSSSVTLAGTSGEREEGEVEGEVAAALAEEEVASLFVFDRAGLAEEGTACAFFGAGAGSSASADSPGLIPASNAAASKSRLAAIAFSFRDEAEEAAGAMAAEEGEEVVGEDLSAAFF